MKDSIRARHSEEVQNDYSPTTYSYGQPIGESVQVTKKGKKAWLDQPLGTEKYRFEAPSGLISGIPVMLNEYNQSPDVLDDLMPILGYTSENNNDGFVPKLRLTSENSKLPQSNRKLSRSRLIFGVFWRMFVATVIGGVCVGGIISYLLFNILDHSSRHQAYNGFGLGMLIGGVEGIILGLIVGAISAFFAWGDSFDKDSINSFSSHAKIIIICVCALFGILGIFIWFFVTLPMIVFAIVMWFISNWVGNWFEGEACMVA